MTGRTARITTIMPLPLGYVNNTPGSGSQQNNNGAGIMSLSRRSYQRDVKGVTVNGAGTGQQYSPHQRPSQVVGRVIVGY